MPDDDALKRELENAEDELRALLNSWEGASGSETSETSQVYGGTGSVGWTAEQIRQWDEKRDSKHRELEARIAVLKQKLATQDD